MKVKELIEELQKYDGELEVGYRHDMLYDHLTPFIYKSDQNNKVVLSYQIEYKTEQMTVDGAHA